MNQLFLGVSVLLITSVSFAKSVQATWPKEVIAKLKSKNPYEAFCGSSAGAQMMKSCKAFSSIKDSKQKWPTATLQNGVLSLTDGKRTIQMKRTADATRFEINHKLIDIADHRDGESLYKEIVALTPKVAAQSFWINSAHAEWYPDQATTFDLMSVAAHNVVNSTSDLETCKAAQEFAKQCAVNIENHSEITLFNHFLKKISDGRKFSEDDKRMFSASTIELRVALFKMRNLTKGFDKKTDALIGCPSITPAAGRSSVDDVVECAKMLEDGMRDLTVLPDLVVLEDAQQSQGRIDDIKSEVRTYTDKPAKSSSNSKKTEGTR